MSAPNFSTLGPNDLSVVSAHLSSGTRPRAVVVVRLLAVPSRQDQRDIDAGACGQVEVLSQWVEGHRGSVAQRLPVRPDAHRTPLGRHVG